MATPAATDQTPLSGSCRSRFLTLLCHHTSHKACPLHPAKRLQTHHRETTYTLTCLASEARPLQNKPPSASSPPFRRNSPYRLPWPRNHSHDREFRPCSLSRSKPLILVWRRVRGWMGWGPKSKSWRSTRRSTPCRGSAPLTSIAKTVHDFLIDATCQVRLTCFSSSLDPGRVR